MIMTAFLMLAGVAATAEVRAENTVQPVISDCPIAPAAIPPFGESCDAKIQAKRVSEIVTSQRQTRNIEITRYRSMGDGRVIANERGDVVGVAAPCLLPTEEKPKDRQASLHEPKQKTSKNKAAPSLGPLQSITRCQPEKFALQFIAPPGAGR